MKTHTFIYALLDPETRTVHYIGKTDTPEKRLKNHLQPSALKIKCRRTSWLKGLLNAGKQPVMLILEEVAQECWKERECHWMSHYRDAGAHLMNTAEGGTGGVKPEWITAEMRENMRAAQLGKKRSEESRKKQSETQKGKKRSAEFSAKMSLVHKGKKPSEATRLAQIKAVTGSKRSNETKAKMSAAGKGNTYALRRKYIATDAAGMEYQVANLAAFCREYGLSHGRMNNLANGDKLRKQHKGWTCRGVE